MMKQHIFLPFFLALPAVVLPSAVPRTHAQSPTLSDLGRTAAKKRFDRAIDKFAEVIGGDAGLVYQKYLSADPFPDQDKLLVGRWFGAAEDPDYKSYWRYERREDGTMLNRMIDMDLLSMEYTRKKEESLWQTRGRVLYEFCEAKTDGSEPLTVFLIETLSKTEIEYRMATADEDLEDCA